MKYFLKRSLFLYFRKKEPRKSSLLFQKVTFRAPKCFLFFKKWKFSIPSLKTLVLFLGEPLRVFDYRFFRCFISPLIFTIVFGCFHCWLHLFTSVSSLPWLFFIRYFVFVLLYRESYGRFLPYTPSRHLVQRWLLQQHNCTNLLPWPQAVPLWRLRGLPLMFKTETRPICLFESHSIQQKVLVGRFYLCIKALRNTM